MITLTMLPGSDGDCLLLSYGTEGDLRRVLIDAGRRATYPLLKTLLTALGPAGLDLLVVTHVDQDHILGVLELFADPGRVAVGEVWFNGFDHLMDVQLETFGPQDGERLTTMLMDQRVPWNRAFGGRSVEVGRTSEVLLGGGSFRVVAPDRTLLDRLTPVWSRVCRAEGLLPGVDPRPPVPEGFEAFGAPAVDSLAATAFRPDTSRANGSSIAFLFEFEGVRLLFTGDGDDDRIVRSLRPPAEAEGGRLRLDALKVAHHGSAANTSQALLDLIDCPLYLISTDGSRHAHPDPVAMSRILVHGGASKQIAFNYRDRAALWDDPGLRERYGYTVVTAPAGDDGSLTLSWGPVRRG
jgi:beta-lactamase superfamily II metal-dependent hydrolase